MAKVTMPQLGESVAEGTIGKWLKKPGDHVAKYEPLLEVITDKVNAEVPSPFEGVLKEILVEEGATVPNNAEIAVIEEGGAAAASAAAPAAKAEAAPAKAEEPAPAAAKAAPAPGEAAPAAPATPADAAPAAPTNAAASSPMASSSPSAAPAHGPAGSDERAVHELPGMPTRG